MDYNVGESAFAGASEGVAANARLAGTQIVQPGMILDDEQWKKEVYS